MRSIQRFSFVILAAPALFGQKLDDHCTVSVLNRTAQVKPDGTWQILNIPATTNPVRATSACVNGGVTTLGQSDAFLVDFRLLVGVDAIFKPLAAQIPLSLSITVPATTLTAPNQTAQLRVIATLPDKSLTLVSSASSGTTYSLSNSNLASISADGLITAKASGNLLVQAINQGTQGIIKISIALTGDSDGDGIPDDVEIANGLDPNNPADALDDPDHDGLTNLEEFRAGTDMHNPDTDGDGLMDGPEVKTFHTNPLLKDTDNDGVPDGIEVATGSDPNDPNSFNLAAALSGIRVSPTSFSIAAGPSGNFQQLTVTGDFKAGGTIDLTATHRGTTYTSSNLQICRFTAMDGQVFAVSVGNCAITVSNGAFSQTVNGVVTGNPAQGLSSTTIPGFGNAIDTLGSFAYVAAGAAGLLIFDTSDPLHPSLKGSLIIPGNGNDVRVIGNLAYMAAGSAGLVIVDVSNPAAPVVLGSADTPGEATHIFVFGDHAYIGDGPSGVAILNVANPAAPALIKQVTVPEKARGMDVVRTPNGNTYLLVARQATNLGGFGGQQGMSIIDITNPASAFVAVNLSLASSIPDPVNLRVFGNSVYVVGFAPDGTHVVDISNILAPVPQGPFSSQIPRAADIEFTGHLAVDGNALLDASNPLTPVLSSQQLAFAAPCLITGTVLSGALMYNSCEPINIIGFPKAAGTPTIDPRIQFQSGFNISQILANQDTLGVPPQVTLLLPAANSTVIQGSTITLHAIAQDDVALTGVTFTVNGVDILTDTSFPYAAHFTVPANATSLTITVRATDLGNNSTTTPAVTLNAIADPLTTASGTVLNARAAPVAGASVTCLTSTATTGADGHFSIAGLPTIKGAIVCNATSQSLHGTGAADPAGAATTNLGNITIK